MAYEKLTPKPAQHRNATRKGADAGKPSPRRAMVVVSEALTRASEETRNVSALLKSGEPDTTLAKVEAIFRPVPVTHERVQGLAELTDSMAKELERARSGDTDVKIIDKENGSALAAFRTARRGSAEDQRDTMTVYPAFFQLSKPGQIYTLIHEATHAALPTVDIDVYSWTRLFTALQGAPEQLQNPDAVAYFVRMMYKGASGSGPVKPLSDQERDLGQAGTPKADSVDPTLPEPERRRIVLAVAVAEAKVRIGMTRTEPAEGSERGLAPRPPSAKGVEAAANRELYTVLAAVQESFFRQAINVNMGDEFVNPLNRGRPGVRLPEGALGNTPRGPYRRVLPRMLTDTYALADILLAHMMTAVSGRGDVPDLTPRRIASYIRTINIYFRRPPEGPMYIEP